MEKLINSKISLMISSLDKDNKPAISYAPYCMVGENIYVYLSKAAEHYYNLRDNKYCSVMIIEDETNTNNIFARERVSFECEAEMLSGELDELFEEFSKVQDPKMVDMLKNMDFDMFKLSIKKGRHVQGFGKAFDLKFVDGKIESKQATGVGGVGHSKK